MPVSDVARLHALAQQLVDAGSTQDWERVQQLDQLVVQWLATPSGGMPQDLKARAAWQQVAQAHAHARSACQVALNEAGTRLRDLHNQNEAHKAYAWQEQLS